MLAGHAAEAAALERAAMEALLPVLQQARGELNRDLARWINTGAGDARYTPQAYRNSLLAIDASMNAMNTTLTPALVRVLGDFDGIARRLANTQTARELSMFAQPGFSDVLPDVPVRVAAGLVTSRNAPMARYETSAARYTGQVARDIRRELAVGVVRGESLTDLTLRLQRLGGPAGAVAVQGIAGTVGAVVEVIPEGLFNRYEYWAERLVRTELAYAHNEQLQDIANDLRANEDMPDLTRRWDASADGRLCPRCQDMHGVTADPRTDVFPGGIDNPPLHPNCRCRAGLWRPSWERFMSRDYRDAGGPDPVMPPPAPPRPATAPAPRPARPRANTAPAPAFVPHPPAPAPAPAPRLLSPPSGRGGAITNDLSPLGTAADRLAALGVDAEAMGDALAAVPVCGTSYPAVTAAEATSMTTIRDGVRGLLNRWAGLTTRDTMRHWLPSRAGLGFWIDNTLKAAKTRAMHFFTGQVHIDADVCAAAARAFRAIKRGAAVTAEEWSAVRTLLHEETHGCSLALGAAFERHGVVWEEILTDVLARRATRELAGEVAAAGIDSIQYNFDRWTLTPRGWRGGGAVTGSYAQIIERGVEALCDQLHVTPQQAVGLLERASIAQRRGVGRQVATADGYTTDLSRRLLKDHHGRAPTADEVRRLNAVLSSTRFRTMSGRAPWRTTW